MTTLEIKCYSTLSVCPVCQTHTGHAPNRNPSPNPLPKVNLMHSTLLGEAIDLQGSKIPYVHTPIQISPDLFQLKLQATLLKEKHQFSKERMEVSGGHSLQKSDMVSVCVHKDNANSWMYGV